uniref:Uncharacterized protein n=1 Tax=Labrus bergylta TaxID=56723 RepID=A0A3Q3EZJ6_9LABR
GLGSGCGVPLCPPAGIRRSMSRKRELCQASITGGNNPGHTEAITASYKSICFGLKSDLLPTLWRGSDSAFPHSSHLYGRSPVCSCLFSDVSFMNCFPQLLQGYRTPMWICSTWLVSCSLVRYLFPHCQHRKGFSPVCFLSWHTCT